MRRLVLMVALVLATPAAAEQVGEIGTDWTGNDIVIEAIAEAKCDSARKHIVAPDGSASVPTSQPQPDGTLVETSARAWLWQRMLDEGVYTSIGEIGDSENLEELREPDPAAGAAGARYCGGNARRADEPLMLEG